MKSIKKVGDKIAKENQAGKKKSLNSPMAKNVSKENKDIARRDQLQDEEIMKKDDKADRTMAKYKKMPK